MKFERFEDIVVWQKSRDMALVCYKNFKPCRDFSFRDQIQRAVVSVMNNIAEGFERTGNKEFRRFLIIAKGSSGEARSMLDLALSLGYLSYEEQKDLYSKSVEISKMLAGLIKTLK